MRLETIEKGSKGKANENGSAIVIALFVLALVGAFAALAMTRTATEAAAVGNEAAEARTFYAAQGSLETMTRNFNKVFEIKLSPTEEDLDKVLDKNKVPVLPIANGGDFDFKQELLQTSPSKAETLPGGTYAGLYALRDNWRLRTTATDTRTQTQVQLTRHVLNNRIPIFQFGIFYDDDLELFRPPEFNFGGRVHSNRHFFISPGTEGVYFDSRVTAVGHIITQSWRNGNTTDAANSETWIKNASGVFKRLSPTMGSVLNGTPNEFGPGKPFADPDMPSSKLNSSFSTQVKVFDGNLKAKVDPLKLPLKVGGDTDLIEMIRRGKQTADTNGGDIFAGSADDAILRSERFANKTGIRVSLADSKAKLPGCATDSTLPLPGPGTAVTTPCGVRLDGHISGNGSEPAPTPSPFPATSADFATHVATDAVKTWSRGYQPRAMKLSSSDAGFNYKPTRVNGERLYMGTGRQVWIKIETVQTNETTGAIETKDITEDILSLGMTEEAPSSLTPADYSGTRASLNNGTPTAPSANLTATTAQTALTFPDSRSVLKIQRFTIPGDEVPRTTPTATAAYSTYNSGSGGYNYVRRYTSGTSAMTTGMIAMGCQTAITPSTDRCSASNGNADPTISANGNNANDRERYGHLKLVSGEAVVPFPIEMFDSREGEYYDAAARYTAGKVTHNGVMSMIDIDVANLRRFLRGDFNGLFPVDTPFEDDAGHTLTASFTGESDIPQDHGWVLYVSDRRGDQDFDGEYDMEDIYSPSPGNTGAFEKKGEDVNQNNVLDAKYIKPALGDNDCIFPATVCEAAKYQDEWEEDFAAVIDHKYYRRGVRLINGTTVPGIYDKDVPANTRGFTLASENGVYIKGNFNATHVTSRPTDGNTLYNNYRPFDSAVHIPASIVADGITILSNNWKDAESFRSPYSKTAERQASDTTIRFAMIAGDTIATFKGTVNQGTSVNAENMNGGVHNFKRFLEKWSGDYLDYSGSLINLYNSRNNNGSFKCCNTVYDPPFRNWVFDSTFLDPTRLPPGAPFFQYVQTTGFERTNN